MSVIPELAYIQKSSCELLFFAAPPIESPLNFYRGISIVAIFFVKIFMSAAPEVAIFGDKVGSFTKN